MPRYDVEPSASLQSFLCEQKVVQASDGNSLQSSHRAPPTSSLEARSTGGAVGGVCMIQLSGHASVTHTIWAVLTVCIGHGGLRVGV